LVANPAIIIDRQKDEQLFKDWLCKQKMLVVLHWWRFLLLAVEVVVVEAQAMEAQLQTR
jgi:hypothetical protein